jgi:hypothetical protein
MKKLVLAIVLMFIPVLMFSQENLDNRRQDLTAEQYSKKLERITNNFDFQNKFYFSDMEMVTQIIDFGDVVLSCDRDKRTVTIYVNPRMDMREFTQEDIEKVLNCGFFGNNIYILKNT